MRRNGGGYVNDTLHADALQLFLARRDIPCPRCTYNLRGCSTDRCPECGARIELMIGSPDRKLGLWMAGLIAVAVPFGFNLVLALLASWGLFQTRNQPWAQWREHDWILFATLWGAALLAGVAIGVHSRLRARFLCAPRRLQVMVLITMLTLAGSLQAGVLVMFKLY